MDKKQTLAQYAALKQEIKVLEEQLELLKEPVMEIMSDADELQTEFGTFTKASRRSYTYPAFITTLDEQLKEKKKEAEATGTATYTEKPYIVFKNTIK